MRKFFLFVVVLLLFAAPAAAQASVTSTALGTTATAGSASTVQLTVTHAAAVGDLAVVEVEALSNSTTIGTSAVTDSVGNTWTKATNPNSPGWEVQAMTFYSKLTHALVASSSKITLTTTGTASKLSEYATNYVSTTGWPASGILDQSASNNHQTATTETTPTTAATGQADELVVGWFVTGSGTYTAGTGYTANPNGTANISGLTFVESKETNSTGTQVATATHSVSSVYDTMIDTFKPSLPAVPVNSTLPAVTGTAQQGSTLTTDNGTWTNSPTSYAYQWEDCDSSGLSCTSITGATSNTHVLAAGDVGHTIRSTVTASNSGGASSPASSAQTAVVTASPQPPANTTLPTISGTAQQGQTLTVTNGTWSGDTPMTFTYQWQDCSPTCADITGATSSTYTLQSSDVGDTVDATVTATNDAGNASATTGQTATVTASGTQGGPCNGCSWNGDFSTKGWTQYDDCNASNMDGIFPTYYHLDTITGSGPAVACPGLGTPGIVNDVTPPTGFQWAGKYTLDSGAVKSGEAGERALDTLFPVTGDGTTGKTQGYQGADEWYRDMVYFPAGFQGTTGGDGDWNWIYEMHDAPDGPCCADLAMNVMNQTYDGGAANGERLSVRIEGGGTPSQPVDSAGSCAADSACQITWIKGPSLVTGHWYDVVFHIHWDWRTVANGGSGAVTYWLDGTRIGSYSGPTLFYRSTSETGSAGPGQAYLDAGFYRPTDSSAGYAQPAESLYHAADMVGATEASIGETFTP